VARKEMKIAMLIVAAMLGGGALGLVQLFLVAGA
jgi:hypothetical protein